MLPRIQAEESLLEADRALVVSGTPETRKAVIDAWRDQAGFERARATRATLADLAALGIGHHHGADERPPGSDTTTADT